MSTQTTLARNLSKRQLGGVIFGCTASTMKECLDKNLFGLPPKHIEYVRNVDVGMPLFLFNYDDRTLHGIFRAACRGQLNIDMHAWAEEGEIRTRYPAQVRVYLHMKCEPLSEVHFKPIIIDNYYSHCHFWFELDNTQTRKLSSRFCSSEIRPFPPVPRNLPNLKWTDVLTGRGNDEGSTSLLPKEEFVDPWLSDGTSATSDISPCQGVDNKKMGAFGDVGQGNVIIEELIPSRDFSELNIKGKEVEVVSTDNSSWDWETREDNMLTLEKKDGGESSDMRDCDYPAILAQLHIEMEDLKAFKQEQTTKIESLEKSLAEMKDHCQKLENICMRLEFLSNKSTSVYGDRQSIELPGENDWKINEAILILGGYDNVSWSSTLDLFSPSRDSLKSLKPMSCARAFASAVKFEEELYVCGGGYSSTPYETGRLTVERFDGREHDWSRIKDMEEKRGGASLVALKEKLYAIGGYNGRTMVSSVEMYEPRVGKWTSVEAMNQQRGYMAAAVLDDCIYTIGGAISSIEVLDTIECYREGGDGV